MEIKWKDIVFGFYCLGCMAIVLLALLGYNGLTLALIYAGFTLLCLAIFAVVAWLRNGGGKWLKNFSFARCAISPSF